MNDEELDCLISYDSITKKTQKYILKERYDKIQNNWNELKKWLEEMIEYSSTDIQRGTLRLTLSSMQKLEGNNE